MRRTLHLCSGPSEYARLTTPRETAVRCTYWAGCHRKTRDPHKNPKCWQHWRPKKP